MFLGDRAPSTDASSSSKNVVGLCVFMEVICLSPSLPSSLLPSLLHPLHLLPLLERSIKIKKIQERKPEQPLKKILYFS